MTRAKARMSFFIGFSYGFGRVDVRFGRGWPRVPFEHQVGGTKEQVCPIALGYRVGALRD